jgi:hypothetical protein
VVLGPPMGPSAQAHTNKKKSFFWLFFERSQKEGVCRASPFLPAFFFVCHSLVRTWCKQEEKESRETIPARAKGKIELVSPCIDFPKRERSLFQKVSGCRCVCISSLHTLLITLVIINSEKKHEFEQKATIKKQYHKLLKREGLKPGVAHDDDQDDEKKPHIPGNKNINSDDDLQSNDSDTPPSPKKVQGGGKTTTAGVKGVRTAKPDPFFKARMEREQQLAEQKAKQAEREVFFLTFTNSIFILFYFIFLNKKICECLDRQKNMVANSNFIIFICFLFAEQNSRAS